MWTMTPSLIISDNILSTPKKGYTVKNNDVTPKVRLCYIV